MGIALAAGFLMFWAMSLIIDSFVNTTEKKVLIYQRVGSFILTLAAFGLLYTAVT